MHNNYQYRVQLIRIAIITLCWAALTCILFFFGYSFLYAFANAAGVEVAYPWGSSFMGFILAGSLGGLVSGYLLVFQVGKKYQRRSFGYGILSAFAAFLLVFALINSLVALIVYISWKSAEAGTFYIGPELGEIALSPLKDPATLSIMLIYGLMLAGTQFMLQVNDKFGQGVLWNFITGKYFHPREEERIFMFLDLRSSTTIAEKIGHKQYFELLNVLFRDVTAPIIAHGGEIYQYVGDEVVISWTMKNGLSNANCIRCFFAIQDTLHRLRAGYEQEYGLLPEFKGGLHYGPVTVGEVGIIKKDIVFSGDVLNTAARIQSECNRHQVNILASSALLERLPQEEMFEFIVLEKIQLRGKQEEVEISTIVPVV